MKMYESLAKEMVASFLAEAVDGFLTSNKN